MLMFRSEYPEYEAWDTNELFGLWMLLYPEHLAAFDKAGTLQMVRPISKATDLDMYFRHALSLFLFANKKLMRTDTAPDFKTVFTVVKYADS